MDCSPPGSSVHRISQAILERVATSFSRGSSRPRDQTGVSCSRPADPLPLSHLGSPNKEEQALNESGSPGSAVGIKKIPFIP